MIGTLVRVGRWHLAIPLAFVFLTIGLVQQSTYVEIPLVDRLVPTEVLIALMAITVCLLPLYSSFGSLERTLVRLPRARLVQVAGSCALTGACAWPAVRADDVVPLMCLVLSASIAAVVVVGEYAWLVGLTLGFGAIFLDGAAHRPFTSALNTVPLAVWVAAIVVSGLAYWRFGPRETRT